MNKDEALAFDKQHHLLPGGQGEHDFSVLWDSKTLWEHLNNFAEMCGGLYQGGNPAVLHTCDDWVFLIHFPPDRSRVVKVEQAHAPSRITLYWDERRERPDNGYYGGFNADQPFLSDWELTDGELAEDAARIEREIAETPPPPPPRVDHAKIFREGLGWTAEQVRNPSLTFELLATTNFPGTFDLLESEIANLGRMERMKQKYPSRVAHIHLRKPIKSEADGPQVGDVIIRKRTDEGYCHNYKGVVTKSSGELSVCYSASPFWNPVYALHGHGAPDCSGGPFDTIVVANCQLMGQTLQHYWYWRDGWAGGGCGVNYECTVNLWHWID